MSLISVVIPARNEAKNVKETIEGIVREFKKNNIQYEIIVVNDNSTDETTQVVSDLINTDSSIRLLNGKEPFGFGNAIKRGLNEFTGDYVIITMADSSDDPKDMVRYVEEMKKGKDCCFGSRWDKEAFVSGYPWVKLVLNRMANWFIRILFGLPYNDVTNAFKGYSKEAIDGIKPILSHHFNVTVELPLKAIIRGYSYQVIPTDWHERRKGETSFKIQEMGSRYLFIILYIFLEKLLCKRDYQKR